jgi:ribosomal protein S18 acetylase RimI-like enzyme
MKWNIRPVVADDIDGLKGVLDSSELFPSAYLEGMMADYLHNPATEHIWLTCEAGDRLVAIAYCAPEQLTNGTYNLYAIAVHKDLQGQGIGSATIQYLEHLLQSKKKRILIIETSSAEQYLLTRKLYLQLGYRVEATITGFWNEGEDKVIFWKQLSA